MEHALAPALGQAVNGWQVVAYAGGQHEACSAHGVGAVEFDDERIAILTGRGRRAVVPVHVGIGGDVGAALGGNVGGRLAVARQKAVRIGGVAVAALARVDHQDAAPCARQLQRGRQAGVAAADDDGVVGQW